MALSRSAQAARSNGYGTLKQFREVAQSKTYQIAAYHYEKKHKLAPGSASKATSVFARYYGKAFYKDGKQRVKPPPSYLARVQRTSGTSLTSTSSFDTY